LEIWGPKACIPQIREFLEEFLFGDGMYVPRLGISQASL
jgi:hypothetical protein